ncbi:hypothetical protein [Microbispora sp. NPDC049633]|uniref:hypothetical protein n=1 Tax=Microbispora sp. NPDC049633 TaxID=3154355 RepID=UPI00341BD37D
MEHLIATVLAGLARYRLSGDEDCGVDVQCRNCNTDGSSFAYYDGGLGPSTNPDVPSVKTLPELVVLVAAHELTYHTEGGKG